MPLKKELVGILHVATCTGTAVHVAFSLAERAERGRLAVLPYVRTCS